MVNTDAASATIYVDDDFFTDPQRYYRQWRENGPVQHVQFAGGMPGWVVLGYAESRAALADPRLRKGHAGIVELFRRKGAVALFDGVSGQPFTAHMLNSDPPDHTRLRKLVNKAFTPRRVAELRPRIEQIATELADMMAAKDEADLLREFAEPVPITVICELLGVPFEDRASFQAWTKLLLGNRGDMDEQRRAAGEMGEYLQALVTGKRAHPGADLLSGLVQASDDGDELSEQELVSMAFLLLVAGHETTVNLIGNGSYALLRNKSQFDALRADPSAVPAAVEEFLRYDGPVGWATLRYTAEPVIIGGVEIPAGELVHIVLNAANRDSARYHEPDTLDTAADASGHLAFGHGIHFCVGAPLARLEAAVAFTTLLQRFPDLALADTAYTPTWQQSLIIHGLTELPVRLR